MGRHLFIGEHCFRHLNCGNECVPIKHKRAPFIICSFGMLKMESFLTLPFLLILSSTVRADTSSSKWYRSPLLDNKSSQGGSVFTSRSLIHCARECESDNTCQSFFYMKNKQLDNCVLLSTVLVDQSSQDLFDPQTESAYYIMENAIPTTTASTATTPTTTTSTTTTTTAYPPFSCPADDTVFRTVRLSDTTLMTYRVFKISKNQTDAAASCVSVGGFLARVTTVAKMNTLLTLTSCPGYPTYDYYVDGSNAQSGPTWDSWIMANNVSVPMSFDFWANSPSAPHIEHCLRMRADVAHKWNDCLCSNLYFYICEK